MSFGYYMNMEKISLEIAQNHVELMKESIIDDEIPEFLDVFKVENNIKNGFVIITQLITFIESFLNTIINFCMEKENDLFLKMSIDEKIELICLYYKVESHEIKSKHYWEKFKKMNKIRNELIHYKKSYICDCTAIQDFLIANTSIKEYFNKFNMDEQINNAIDLTNYIAELCDLKINSDVSIIECDAKDGLVSYVFDAKMIDYDKDRNIL